MIGIITMLGAPLVTLVIGYLMLGLYKKQDDPEEA